MGNLSYDVTREELIETFSAAGKVVDVKVPTDRETGRPRGFAFVEFADDDSAHKSIDLLNGRSLRGRALRVNAAEDRPPRPAGAGGPSFRPSPGGAPFNRAAPSFAPPPDFSAEGFDRGRPPRGKGSRRNIRRRKRGFD